MVRPHHALQALIPFALHGLAREVDGALGVLLHTTLDLPGFVGEALSLLDPMQVLGRVLAWTAAGAVVWAVLAAERGRRESRSLADALREEAGTFGPLLLRPAVTALALVALALLPTFPYGFTLPVALTQDWGIAQDLAAIAVLVALRFPAVRLPVPNTSSVLLLAFLAYGFLSPEWARHWDNHSGNEPKTLRMAVAVGHDLTLDAEGVSAAMEELTPEPFASAAGAAAATLARESWLMAQAAFGGAVGRDAIEATRLARQTVRGKDGGVYYVLAPGPSLLLAAPLRIDRVLNRTLGTEGRLAVTLLFWNLLAAGLVAALFRLARDASGRPGIAALLAGGFALIPPFIFYSYQFYPEMLGALTLALALHELLCVPRWTTARLAGLGLLLATLPWLHQKFLPLWGVLVLMAIVMAVDRLVSFRALLALLLPQFLSLYLTALYNFAITGSVRPDALFLAWGPGGVTTARIGDGLLGIALDARYGILPYAPIYLLAVASLALPGRRAGWLRLALPVAAVYYLTVAAADNWSGAVCNLGRYFMPLAPLLLAFLAVAFAELRGRRGAVALALVVSAWTAIFGVLLYGDPHAANDGAVLIDKSVFADGNVYLPNLFFRSWNYAAPGHATRVVAWLVGIVLLGVWLRRMARGRGGTSPQRLLAGLAVFILAATFVLERWPSPHGAARLPEGIELGTGVTAFVAGDVSRGDGALRSKGGEVDLLVRSRERLGRVRLEAWGEGALWLPGGRRVFVPSNGLRLDVELERLRDLVGRRGVRESLSRLGLRIETPSEVYLRLSSES